ncbi:RcnB family protein [Acinetobacter sp. WZC-1]|uniref:RcnB family protein n=1 Tax=Acinetobacter sp. WZC-1 TaxID=3459034 RepID=UPI00403DB416
MYKIMMLMTAGLFCMLPVSGMADAKDWNNYRAVERHSHTDKSPYTSSYQGYATPYGHSFTQQYPVRPSQYLRPLPRSYADRPYTVYPPNNGVTIIYNHQFPTQTEYHSDSQAFVNGDGHASIESSTYTLISDWRRYNLPDPAVGMHWIFQHGRYLQVPND